MTSINFGFSQDKLGFGNMPEGVDSAGFGTVTTWVKKASADSVYLCGEWYKTVTIGTQTWLQRNLHCDDLEGGIYSYNDDTEISDEYGYLYTIAAAGRIDALIEGWHFPSRAELTTLSNYVNGYGKLKEVGYTHWNSPNTGATNESGFTAFGGGIKYVNSYYYHKQFAFILYSDTQFEGMILYYNNSNYSFISYNGLGAGSLRLIKD